MPIDLDSDYQDNIQKLQHKKIEKIDKVERAKSVVNPLKHSESTGTASLFQ